MLPEMIVYVLLYGCFAVGYLLARRSKQHMWLAPGAFVSQVLLFLWVAMRVTLFPETAHHVAGRYFAFQVVHDLAGTLGILTGIFQCFSGALKLRPPVPAWVIRAHGACGRATFLLLTVSFVMSAINFVASEAISLRMAS
ncbi:hypothetical protein LJR230_002169 [Trinickia sp. LjRoot230]|uniref:hypothetical protein n=1 Tax=Trinickia sp. LjRoot230 TaxID=3342288 RepID=UPI003ECEEA58